MILPKYKFEKIKPYIRTNVPTGLYVLMRDQYNNDNPLDIEDYFKLFREYCTDREISNLEKKFHSILNIDMKVEGSNLPFIKDIEKIEVDEDGGDSLNSIKFRHKITTSFSSEDKKEDKKELDNKSIEKLIKKSIKPEETSFNLDNGDISSNKM